MPNAQNVETLAKIKEDLEGVAALWVVDYRGLTVKQAQELRRNIREAGAHLTVYKNTLMKIALRPWMICYRARAHSCSQKPMLQRLPR